MALLMGMPHMQGMTLLTLTPVGCQVEVMAVKGQHLQ
jgi:hypothetical protein